VVITLDTTESKASLIADIQATIPMLVKRLFGDLPQLRLSVLGHGDYDTRPYVMRLLDFTDNASHVREFVQTSERCWFTCFYRYIYLEFVVIHKLFTAVVLDFLQFCICILR